MFLKAKKLLGSAAAAVFMGACLYSGSLESSYVYYPRSPTFADGRIIPYPVKGIVVYITQDQRQLLSWLTWIEIASGAVLALVILVHGGDPFRSKKN
jgi:hypothetical protein